MLNKLKKIAKDMLAIPWICRTYGVFNLNFPEPFSFSQISSRDFSTGAFLTFNGEQSTTIRGRRNYYRNKSSARPPHVEELSAQRSGAQGTFDRHPPEVKRSSVVQAGLVAELVQKGSASSRWRYV